MMPPYRKPSPRAGADADAPPLAEEAIVCGVVALVGAVPSIGAALEHLPFGAEATIGFVMLALGSAGLFATGLRALTYRRAVDAPDRGGTSSAPGDR
jgi:hypothetical protein